MNKKNFCKIKSIPKDLVCLKCKVCEEATLNRKNLLKTSINDIGSFKDLIIKVFSDKENVNRILCKDKIQLIEDTELPKFLKIYLYWRNRPSRKIENFLAVTLRNELKFNSFKITLILLKLSFVGSCQGGTTNVKLVFTTLAECIRSFNLNNASIIKIITICQRWANISIRGYQVPDIISVVLAVKKKDFFLLADTIELTDTIGHDRVLLPSIARLFISILWKNVKSKDLTTFEKTYNFHVNLTMYNNHSDYLFRGIIK